ncbi:VOC family protein [Haloarchaeobius sp. DFWS5]|uniref:VOC family protein n=1 Tax=Haloarchaeobius sp. DFWS5 TaxID=3446114 RepID=UPI003EB9C4C4
MTDTVHGFHHVSVISGDPQANVDFCTDVLGLRLVKRTVNYDDKFAYHLYYGDERGERTLFTTFPYQRGAEGRLGKPQPVATAFSVPPGALDFWQDRLERRGFPVEDPTDRFGDTVLEFGDGDGQPLELVATATDQTPATDAVPAERAIRDVHSVTLQSASVFHTAATLEVLGFDLQGQEGDRVRYVKRDEDGTATAVVDLLDTDAPYGREGSGTVHHVAFDVGEQSLSEWRARLTEAGLEPTWVKDRNYFQSVYFREPGGILFELATTKPGLTVDESVADLGSGLRLPPQYEQDREMITSQLPTLELPAL